MTEPIQLLDKFGDTYTVERYDDGDISVEVEGYRVLLTPDMVDELIEALGGTPPERPVELYHGMRLTTDNNKVIQLVRLDGEWYLIAADKERDTGRVWCSRTTEQIVQLNIADGTWEVMTDD
jgi:hypothetical protein